MIRPRSINRFKLLIASVVIAASAGCDGIVQPVEDRDCRDEFEAPDGYRPLCEDANPIQ